MRELLCEKITKIYVLLIILIYPLFYTNNYINILQSKRFYYDIVSIVYLLFMIICSVGVKIKLENKYQKILLCISIVSIVLSTIFSRSIMDSFFAYSKRMLGAGFILLCICSCYFIAKFFIWKKWMLIVFFIINTFMSSIVILDNWHIDFAGMKDNLVVEEHYMFTGTLGNINVNATYFSMVLPLCAVCTYLANRYKGILMGCLIIITMASLCLRSDSIIISFLVTMFGLAIYNLIKKDEINMVIKSYIGLFLGIFLVQLLYIFAGAKAYPMDAMTERFVNGLGWIVIIVLLCIIKISKCLKKEKEVAVFIMIMLGILIVCAVMWWLLFSTDEFGTQRGYVWRRTLLIIREEGLLRLFLGHGFNRFKDVFHSYYEVIDKPYLDAHNEILQMIMSVGLLGTFGYVGLFIYEIKECIKLCKHKSRYFAPLMVFISYLFQGLVNNPHIFTLPIIFIFMAVTTAMRREVTNDERDS